MTEDHNTIEFWTNYHQDIKAAQKAWERRFLRKLSIKLTYALLFVIACWLIVNRLTPEYFNSSYFVAAFIIYAALPIFLAISKSVMAMEGYPTQERHLRYLRMVNVFSMLEALEASDPSGNKKSIMDGAKND